MVAIRWVEVELELEGRSELLCCRLGSAERGFCKRKPRSRISEEERRLGVYVRPWIRQQASCGLSGSSCSKPHPWPEFYFMPTTGATRSVYTSPYEGTPPHFRSSDLHSSQDSHVGGMTKTLP